MLLTQNDLIFNRQKMLHTMRALFPSLTMSNREELADELDFRDFDADFVFF